MEQGSWIKIETGVYFTIALLVLMMPLWFFISLIIAAGIHEICHYLVLKLCDVMVYQVSIGPFGASIETESMDPGRELVSALAGPVGSFILVLIFRWVPGIALCGLIQGIFNLLPIYPMDGGRIMKCMLEILKIPQRDKIIRAIEWMTILGILILGFWGKWRWNLGCGGIVIGVILLLRIIRRNISCKESRFGVQ